MYTPHHDRTHAFKATIDGTLDVEVHGSIWPAKIFGRFFALCAIIRIVICTLWVCLFAGKYDVYVID